MQKSIELLDKLRECLEKGTLEAKKFPREDVIEMVREEYNEWMTERIHLLGEYIGIYNMLIENAVDEEDQTRLSEIITELAEDMRGVPIDALDRIDTIRKSRDDMIVKGYIRNAKAVYSRYLYQFESGETAFQGKGVIYTVITGGYDVLKEPKYISPQFEYICFTDNKNLKSSVWNMRYIENPEGLDKVRLARKYKILCFKYLKEYDYSVYIDGKIQVIGDLRKYIEKYSKGRPMLCFPHFVRECAYEEAIACIKALKDDAEIIIDQMKKYGQEGYPPKDGLIDSACLVRQHTDITVQEVMNCWWKEVKEKSRRDQLSFGYACWKSGFHYDLSDLFIYNNEFICKRRDGEAPY